jgi:hypothetical protein
MGLVVGIMAIAAKKNDVIFFDFIDKAMLANNAPRPNFPAPVSLKRFWSSDSVPRVCAAFNHEPQKAIRNVLLRADKIFKVRFKITSERELFVEFH